ncbi:MAG: redoxin domain-containing protein [Anaerolineae bacterium]|nr:redoxin domain-containing protein [Anaerolineae bacterium]MBL6966733.1 redoxin domain-containing protein [Anaerolineales bacterium]
MRNALTLITGLIVGVGLGLLVIGFFTDGDSPRMSESLDQSASTSTLAMDAPAPDFELVSLNGESIRLEDLRGQPVLINFWATWCAPCKLEMPAFQDRYEQHAGALRILAVNFDEPRADVHAFADDLGLTFDVLLDPGGEVQRLYQVRGYPTTVLVDADGVVRVLHIGLMTENQLDQYLAELGL